MLTHFKFVRKITFWFVLIFSSFFTLHLFSQNSETLTIATYYPAPSGVYQNLRFFPIAEAQAPACDATHPNNEGIMYYNNDAGQNQLMVCRETAAGVFGWQVVGSSLWQLEEDDLTAGDIDWNVGIGTLNPGAKLHVVTPSDSAARNDLLELTHTNNNTLTISEFGTTHAVIPSTVQIGAWNEEQNISIVTDNQVNIQAGGSTKGVFIKGGGNVGIGTTNPQATLDVAGNAILFPRNANDPGNPVNGMMYYNTTQNKLRVYENGTWKNVTGTQVEYGMYRGNAAGTSTVWRTIDVGFRPKIVLILPHGEGSLADPNCVFCDNITVKMDIWPTSGSINGSTTYTWTPRYTKDAEGYDNPSPDPYNQYGIKIIDNGFQVNGGFNENQRQFSWTAITW